MAIFNFKATEDDSPGGGVYKLPGNGTVWKIEQSKYPNVNLAGMTANNFFKRTICNNGGKAAVTNPRDYVNVTGSYTGGNGGTISYSYSNGIGTVSIVNETRRTSSVGWYVIGEGSDSGSASGGFTHEMYMSRDPIR